MGLLILIFIRPFISSLAFPYLNSIYSFMLLGFLAIWITLKGLPSKQIKPLRYPLVLFVLALIISMSFSGNKLASLEELYKYAIAIPILLISISLSYQDRIRVIKCIVLVGVIIAFMAIYQYFLGFQNLLEYITKKGISDSFILDYASQKRVFFPFVTPNALGGYLAMIIPLTLSYKNKIWLILPLSFALLLTKSLGALISLFLALVLYLYLQGKLKKRGALFLFGLLIIVGLVFITRSLTQKQHLQPIFSTLMRLNYWRDTLGIIKRFPLSGVGIGNFNLIESRYAHNSYLQIWAEIGISGLASILWLIIAILKSTLKNFSLSTYKKQIAGLITANIVFLTHNIIDFTYFLPEVAIIWWIILGLQLPSFNYEFRSKNN